PDAPQPSYILGLIAKTQSRTEEAVIQFQRVLKIDPNDVGSNINLGQIYSQQRKYPEAIAAFRIALAAEPYNATALYNLGQALVRSGQREEGLKATTRFQELRQRGSATTIGTNYLEQGRYAEAVASTGAEPDLVDRATPAVTFTLSPNSFSGPTNVASRSTTTTTSDPQSGFQLTEVVREQIMGATVLFDFDGDSDLDLFRVTSTQRFLYRNDNGTFIDITDQSTAFSSKLTASLTGVVAGDVDNDTKPDLFVIGNGILSLYHNDGGGKFSDVTKAANIPPYPFLASSAAFTDVDHDGDVDIFIAGLVDLSKATNTGQTVFPNSFPGAPDLLLQNDGTGRFSDVTATAGIKTTRHAVAVVPTDFNNRRDMDLLIVSHGTPVEMFSNQRDGTFRNVARETGLPGDGRWLSVAAGDVNKDGYTDFFFGRIDAVGLFAISDGKEKFKTVPAPSGTEFAGASQFLDYDNDGLLDCVLLTIKGLRVLRNVGNDWIDVTQTAVGARASIRGICFSAGDIDNDGDTDLIVLSSEGSVIVLRNDGGNKNNSLRVALTGKVSNRNGIGTKVETRAGSLVQKLETSATSPAIAPADILFGLGKRTSVDALRLLWPSGIVQAETEFPKAAKPSFIKLPITELDRKPSSCPYLYTWNGERFEFITDFMGGGEMGHLEVPGRFNIPDPVEYVRIRGDQLKERNGAYEVRVTNELEEALFADRFQLIAVDHPSETDVFPNEGLTDPPQPFKLFVTRHARPPVAAIDEHGHDVLSQITKMDRIYPDDFRRDRIRGYAEEHTLTLKTADAATASHHREEIVLLLTGWTDYAWSSDNLAASQARKEMMLPALQVKDSQGKWQTVIDNVGIPVGRPQTVTVDLTGKFLSASREVRIVTNMRILWDRILVAKFDEPSSVRFTRLDPAHASLRWRGFSSEVTPDGREPIGYDYHRVSSLSPWKVMPGRYTREGDVRELLLQADDMFVISLPGDEISLSFDARKLPPLPSKWTRTFLLYADGYSKEMDINSAIPDQVLPLPFHGMSGYPYPSRESYPMTATRQAYIDRYNTRVVTNEMLSINSLILGARTSRPQMRR
ncbi:MAG TPA: FG-GAP-like repeat-containing protein, partial [Pyrinomonadaceae bacterium]|nr:FG-GAP-like repeat-containing protein [Pyrinomonadaceae bacterium]